MASYFNVAGEYPLVNCYGMDSNRLTLCSDVISRHTVAIISRHGQGGRDFIRFPFLTLLEILECDCSVGRKPQIYSCTRRTDSSYRRDIYHNIQNGHRYAPFGGIITTQPIVAPHEKSVIFIVRPSRVSL